MGILDGRSGAEDPVAAGRLPPRFVAHDDAAAGAHSRAAPPPTRPTHELLLCRRAPSPSWSFTGASVRELLHPSARPAPEKVLRKRDRVEVALGHGPAPASTAEVEAPPRPALMLTSTASLVLCFATAVVEGVLIWELCSTSYIAIYFFLLFLLPRSAAKPRC
jgi:hypothetical protein